MGDDEKTVLGYLIKHPEYAFEILEGLVDDDFSSPKHKAIFRSIRNHIDEGFDLLILSNALKAEGFEVAVSDLISLEEFCFEGVDISKCKERIRAASQRRSLHDFLTVTIKDLNAGSDLQTVQNNLLEKISSLQEGFPGKTLIKTPSDFITEIKNQNTNKSKILIHSGLKRLDDLLGGFRPGELSEVTGETASGKTTFATAFLPHAISQKGHPVLIASFETKPPSIIRKMVQMTKGRPFHELTGGEIDDAFEFISQMPIYFIDYYGEMGLRELKASIYQAKREFDIEFVVLDHLHFFLKYSAEYERQAIDSALRNIKSWAMDLNIHIILIVHPTKLTHDNKVVQLNDLKGSSGLKQLPDNVFSIWRERGLDTTENPQNEIIIYILKARDDEGNEGKVILTFDKRSQSYSDSGPDLARSVEGRKGSGLSSPSSRPPERNWLDGYDS